MTITPHLTPELQARALELADSRCESDIEIFGLSIEGEPGCYGLTDEISCPVRTLEQAGGTLLESYRWLQARGLASLRMGPEGIIVELHRRRNVALAQRPGTPRTPSRAHGDAALCTVIVRPLPDDCGVKGDDDAAKK